MMNTKSKKEKVKKITYNNKNVGFSLEIPDNWMEVKKTSYKDLGINDNTLFIFVVDKFTSLTAVFSGFCKTRSFNKFFDKFVCDEKYKLIYKNEKEFNKVNVKQIIIENNDKKIMHSFCLINGMLINFTINVDVRNRLFDNKGFSSDTNVKVMNEVLKSINTFEPVNPPIYINDEKEETVENVEETAVIPIIVESKDEIAKKTAQIIIETDCKYKNILVPNFYVKYIYSKNNSNVMLSIVNNEVYFNGFDDCFRFIKVNKDLSQKIKEILDKAWETLTIMDCGYKNIESDSTVVIKIDEKYNLIDLNNENNNNELLKNIFKDIIAEIENYTDIDFRKYDIYPGLKEEMSSKLELSQENLEEINKMFEFTKNEKTTEEKIETASFEKEIEMIEEQNIQEANDNEVVPTIVESQEELDTNVGEIEENVEPVEITESEKVEEEKIENEVSTEEEPIEIEKDETNVIPLIVVPEINETEEISTTNDIYQKYQPNQESMEYDLSTFEEVYHNVDGHASFKFIFPQNSGVKNTRDFNVFDINDIDELVYRVFIFKCENIEKYELKLEDWMHKNIQSNNASIKAEYNHNTKNNLEIRTYIFENDKVYKVAYINGYLIAIATTNVPARLQFADIALDNVEIGEDSKEYIEAYDRKLNSIRILQAQGIPYIDELPIIESSYEVKGKTLIDIAKRAIVLCIACNFASDIIGNKKRRYLKESKKFFNKLLDNFNVKDVMTKDEKALFDKMDKNLAIQISWQFEGYAVLLWTLGLIDEIEFPDTLVDPDAVTTIVSSCETYSEFIGMCQLRDVNEVLDLADLTYRYNWYCVDSKINGEEPVMNSEVVMERHRALNWLLSEEDWDKVEINT